MLSQKDFDEIEKIIDKKLEEKIGERAESLSKAYNWLFMEKKLLNLYENL